LGWIALLADNWIPRRRLTCSRSWGARRLWRFLGGGGVLERVRQVLFRILLSGARWLICDLMMLLLHSDQ
ncbi:hypothetical protein BZY58_29795, partial [Pseudomonas aeruginosa]